MTRPGGTKVSDMWGSRGEGAVGFTWAAVETRDRVVPRVVANKEPTDRVWLLQRDNHRESKTSRADQLWRR